MTFKNITEKSASPDNEIQVYADISPRNSFSMSTKSTSLRAPTPDGVGSQTDSLHIFTMRLGRPVSNSTKTPTQFRETHSHETFISD